MNKNAHSVEISFKDQNPLKAADLANAVATGFIDYDLERKIYSSNRILDFIETQIAEVYKRLKESEVSIQEFQIDNKITRGDDYAGIYIDRLALLEEEFISLELEQEILGEIGLAVETKSDSVDVYDFLPLLAGTQFEQNIKEQIKHLHQLLLEREQSMFEVTATSGRVENLNYQIKIQQNLLIESIRSFRTKIEGRKQNVTKKIKDIEDTFSGMPIKELKHSRLKRVFAINEKFYTLLLEKKAEYAISKAGIVPESVILEIAVPQRLPIFPDRNLTYIILFILALVASIILVIVRYLVYDDIGSLNEIVKLTHASIGTLGIVPKFNDDIPVSQLVVDKKPKSVLAESFRSIRTNLQFISNESEAKIIAITSTISGEGKTFVAINLGGIIAFSGKKVIILDLDMRKPKIHKGFSSDNVRGMSTLLIGKDNFDNTIKQSQQENLDFITAGPVPSNPSELIINGKLPSLLTELKKKYDLIIIDNPPVGIVTEGIACLKMADYPLYIFRAEYSKRSFVQMVDRIVNENKITNLSVILNGVDINRSKYSYNYSYGYGYGYGYGCGYGYGYVGYYEEPEEKESEAKMFLNRLKRKK